MTQKKLSRPLFAISGVILGVINGLLGSGGGMIAVPLLKKMGLDQRTAQANAVAVILPVSIVSIVFYAISGNLPLYDTLPFALGGVLGTFLGTFLLQKMSNKWLNIIFSALMIYAGVRLLLK